MIDTTGSLDLPYSSDRPNAWSNWKDSGRCQWNSLGSRKLRLSQTILNEDLKYRSYKNRVQPFLTDVHKAALANWIRNQFSSTVDHARCIKEILPATLKY